MTTYEDRIKLLENLVNDLWYWLDWLLYMFGKDLDQKDIIKGKRLTEYSREVLGNNAEDVIKTIGLKTNVLTKAELRDVILRIYDMVGFSYIQSDTEMMKRVNKLVSDTVMQDSVMKGFCGYGGSNDLLSGDGSLEDSLHAIVKKEDISND